MRCAVIGCDNNFTTADIRHVGVSRFDSPRNMQERDDRLRDINFAVVPP